jgi:hypothetical protein
MAIEMAPLPEAEYVRNLCAELGYDRNDIVVLWEDGLVYIVRKQQQLYETRIRRPLIDDREDEKIRALLRNSHRRALDTA